MPTSKLVKFEGRTHVAVPHRIEETRFLNNLGLKVPSPILHDYSWPRNMMRVPEPFRAQRITSASLTLHPRIFVLNDLGTGKSLSALWAYDYLRRKGLAKKLLVVCPLSTTERTWADELFFHFPHLSSTVLYGTRAKRLKMLADTSPDVYIINHHGIHIISEALASRPDITHLVIDELAQVGRNRQTDMWKSLNVITNRQQCDIGLRSAWGLTATPTPNEPTDAYAQVLLINPRKAPRSFHGFRQSVMRQVGPYQWVSRDDATDIVSQIMNPCVRFTREDCVDLPPTVYMERHAALSAKQKKAYDAMHSELCAQIESGQILAVNQAVKVGKLVQIACGVVYDEHRNEHVVGAESRVAVALEAIKDSASKTIVFVPYIAPLNYLKAAVDKEGIESGVIHGGVPKRDRDEIFQRFQRSDDKLQVIIAQPSAMSHGLTLTAASTVVWYAPPTSAETYEQANGRITRPGQKHTTVILNIEGTPVERRMYHRLRTKQKMQDLLLTEKAYRE
jgi:SNF2 family DNA or RNA helicase